MFDVVLIVFMTLVSVAAFVNYKKLKMDGHLKAVLVLGIGGMLFAVLAQVEVYIRSAFPVGVTPVLPPLILSFLIPLGWEWVLYWIFALPSALALYLVGALAAAINDVIAKYIR